MAYENFDIGGKKIFGTAGYSVQQDDTPEFQWTLSGNPNDAYYNKVQLGTFLADPQYGGNGAKFVNDLIGSGQATYDPTYGWIADSNTTKSAMTNMFGGSSLSGAFSDVAKDAWPALLVGLGGAAAFGSGLLGAGTAGVEGTVGATGATTTTGGTGILNGAGSTFAPGSQVFGGTTFGELGTGGFGLEGLGTNIIDPAVTATTSTGGTIGSTGGLTTAGAGSTFAPGSEIFNAGSGLNLPNIPTSTPGSGSSTSTPPTTPSTTTTNTGTSWFDRIWNGTATPGDWAKLVSSVGPSILGYLGSQNTGNILDDWYNKTQNSVGMNRFNDSFAPGFDLLKADPALQGAIDTAANDASRAWSARVGNIGGSPGAQNQIINDVTNRTILPWLSNYRGQNLQAAGLGSNVASTFAGYDMMNNNNLYNSIGFGLGRLGDNGTPGITIGPDGKLKFTTGNSIWGI